MNKIEYLQQILGTDKKNPVFSIYRKDENTLHILYGAELLSVVSLNKYNFECKVFIGILYNSGVKVKSLVEAFKLDKKTIKKFGDALKLDSPEEVVSILRGREKDIKFTDEVKAYIRMRFPKIYEENKYSYSKAMLGEIKKIFGKEISSETIRPLLKELKPRYDSTGGKEELVCDLNEQNREQENPLPPECQNNSLENKELVIEDASTVSESEEVNRNNRKCIPPNNGKSNSCFCHHAGIVLFHEILNKVNKTSREYGWILRQWLASILLESVNIEQSKLLDFEDLNKIIGCSISTLRRQRDYLKEIATDAYLDNLIELNAREIDIDQYSDFYYDPHSKHYTGEMKILKGWCGSLGRVDKVMFLDFIHTPEGEPVYISHEDNYYDLRERYKAVTEKFRTKTKIAKDKTLTFIIDRGIYDIKVFKEIVKTGNQHIITWEKNYKNDTAWVEKDSTEFAISRNRNNESDKLQYTFEYLEEDWKRDKQMKLIKVRATNYKSKTIEVGILTDDKKRNSEEIITLIFKRWVQENDFKYLGDHFGINEITSYSTIPYKQLDRYLTDKEIKSGEYKALEMERKIAKKELAQCLLKKHNKIKEDLQLKKEIEKLDIQLIEIKKQMEDTNKVMSKLEFLIEQNYVKLNKNCKSIMDALKIIARNAFHKEIQSFKELYNNYRDDHVVFRNLIQASGIIEKKDSIINIHIMPTMNYPPKLKKIITKVFDTRNEDNQKMPDGSGSNFKIYLAEKEGIDIAISNL